MAAGEIVLRLHFNQAAGRALGSSDFVVTLESATGRRLQPKRPGRKPSAGIRIEQLEFRMPGMDREK